MAKDQLSSPDLIHSNFHFAAKRVVQAAMRKLQPSSDVVHPYELENTYGMYVTYHQAAFDPVTGILYKFENREVAVTPHHEETYGPVITSIGDLHMGLVIKAMQIDQEGYPSHHMNHYLLPRDHARVSDWSMDLSGLSERDTPALLDLAASIQRATKVDVLHYRLCEEALKRKDRSFRTRRSEAA